jgi:hypothetical protein
MSFYNKPSTPLLLVGFGILLFILGLSAVYGLTGKTEAELTEGYSQQLSLNAADSKVILGTAGQKMNLQLAGDRSVGGVSAAEDLALILRNAENQEVLLQVADFASPDWQEESLPSNRQSRQILVPVIFNLPTDLKIGDHLLGEVTGVIRYPVELRNDIIENQTEISQKFDLEIVSNEAMMKQIRQRPLLIIVLSFPLAMILILIGARAELYGRKSRPQA